MSWLIRLFLAGFCVATLGSIAARDARVETRVALVVGNAKYEHADVLANTVNDAMAVSSLLKKAGFDVDERDNLTVVEFKRAVRDFARTAANADIAIVYYSGHGIESSGTNYLIPTDARLANDSDVDDEAIPLDRVLAATRAAKKLSLIILDACRENPFLHLEGGRAPRRVRFRSMAAAPTVPSRRRWSNTSPNQVSTSEWRWGRFETKFWRPRAMNRSRPTMDRSREPIFSWSRRHRNPGLSTVKTPTTSRRRITKWRNARVLVRRGRSFSPRTIPAITPISHAFTSPGCRRSRRNCRRSRRRSRL